MADEAAPELTILANIFRESTCNLALIGAGLSASSGIPTFSGAGATWRGYESRSLATPEAFARQPEVVTAYYREFRERVAAAAPNAGHRGLARLARA